MSAETMSYLAENYKIFIPAISAFLILLYVLILVFSAKVHIKNYNKYTILSAIPIINIAVLFIRKNKEKEAARKKWEEEQKVFSDI